MHCGSSLTTAPLLVFWHPLLCSTHWPCCPLPAAGLSSGGPARLSPELAAAVAHLADFLNDTEEERIMNCLVESEQQMKLTELIMATLPPYFLTAEAAAGQPAAVETYLDCVHGCSALIQVRVPHRRSLHQALCQSGCGCN